MTLLDVVLFLPLVGFLLLLILPKESSRMAAMVISLAVFIVSLGLLMPYWFQYPSGHTFSTDIQWISYPPIRYHVALDGLSLWLVLLSTLLTPIAALVSWNYIDKRVKEYYAFLLLLEFGVIGVFVSMDLFLFYVFWEVSLVPMYFLIGIWGHERRIYAAVKFFLFTMAGSVLMLGAIIFLYNRTGTFDYGQIQGMIQTGSLVFDPRTELLLFLAFFIAFAIKVPIFPLHTWLPDAHVEAPTAGSLMLASVMLKMGTYGLLRFCVTLFPDAAHRCAPWIVGLAIVGIIYGALVALVQPNMKKLVAYSSVSHLGFVVLGIFTFTQQGLDGAVYQMLNHGISTGALFILVGFLYERRHSLEISAYGGVATPAPNLAIIFLITTLASIGLPTLEQFRGRIPGSARHGQRELRMGRVRLARGDLLGVLHAVAVPADVFRKSIRVALAPYARFNRARVGGHRALNHSDGLDGLVRAELPAFDQRAECGHPGTDQKTANRAGGDTGPANRGGVPCRSLTSCRRM